jgi:cytochrome P450
VTLESLNGLTYLDAVVREILRYHPPVSISVREAQKDDVIPLENGFVGRDGKFKDHIE